MDPPPFPTEVRDLLQDGAVPDAVPAAGDPAAAAVPAGLARVRRGHRGGAGGTGQVTGAGPALPVGVTVWGRTHRSPQEGHLGAGSALSEPALT